MPKHTPGPWQVFDAHGLPEVWNADRTVAVCDRVFNGNARLIAAAPDLLAIVELLEGIASKQPPPQLGEWDWPHIASRCREAITKATGDN